MFWPVIAVLSAIAAVALHLWWRARLQGAAELARGQIQRLQEGHQQEVARLRSQQETLLNSMAEGLLLLDGSGRILIANKAIKDKLGATGELRDKTLIEAFRVHELAEITTALATEPEVLGKQIRLAHPVERWLEVNGAVILDAAGARCGAVLVFHDLTKVKHLESARTEFVANVSHELRTPLSLIKGYVETLLDGAKDDPEVREKFLRTIARNAERLRLLIEDLLVISELESGRVRLDLQPIALKPLVDKLLEDFRARAVARNVTVANECPATTLHADPGRLEQVLSNLLDNAIKYGLAGGRVAIGTSNSEKGFTTIFVHDDGPGIPPEALERVFERFYRVDKARSRDQGGTGLGLAIVKHIVQSHGGKAWAKSKVGEGSTFFFSLPVSALPG